MKIPGIALGMGLLGACHALAQPPAVYASRSGAAVRKNCRAICSLRSADGRGGVHPIKRYMDKALKPAVGSNESAEMLAARPCVAPVASLIAREGGGDTINAHRLLANLTMGAGRRNRILPLRGCRLGHNWPGRDNRCRSKGGKQDK